jgi:hypothetical protein
MTTCRTLIRRAMLEIKALSSGEQPSADEMSDGLEVLQEVLDGLFGMGVGQSLSDQIVEIDTDLPANTRALVFATVPLTITLPEMPENGQRVQIKDMVGNLSTNTVSIPAVPSDIVLNTDSGDYVFVYIDSSASWVLVSQLTPDSELPIGDDEFFRLELALRLIPMFGGNLTPESAKAHMRATNRIRARFHVTVITPADDAVTFLSRQSYNTGFNSPNA